MGTSVGKGGRSVKVSSSSSFHGVDMRSAGGAMAAWPSWLSWVWLSVRWWRAGATGGRVAVLAGAATADGPSWLVEVWRWSTGISFGLYRAGFDVRDKC